jgi:hypothetical protein
MKFLNQVQIQELTEQFLGVFFYFYRCTVHIEDPLIIPYQQMH